jgi:NADH-quinone oxidoreductase subunit H
VGIGLATLWTFGLLAAGAGATWWLEPRLLAGQPEWGPATPLQVTPDRRTDKRDPWMYYSGPVLALMGVGWGVVCIPFSEMLVGADVGVGLFYFIVVVDFVVLGISLGGWGTNAPHGIEACYRIVAQLLAYVIALGLAIIGPTMMARSLSTVAIVEAQAEAGLWYIAVQPIGFALYLICGLMQTYRAPFLEPFAERIDYGVLGFYGGWKAVCWRVALAGLLFIVSAMGAVLFLGGYAGPFLPGPVWMLLKTFGVMALMVWGGTQVRLLTTDEMLQLAWKILIPVGLVNVLLVGALILLGVGQSPFS